MLKKTVVYEDFNGVTQKKDLYFNLSKADIADNLELEERLTKMSDQFRDVVERDLSRDETRDILELLKDFIRLSYGSRSADGERFMKTEKIWEDFRYSAAYDAFLFGLFENPVECMEFLVGILPNDIRKQAEQKMAEQQPQLDFTAAPEPSEDDVLADRRRKELEDELRLLGHRPVD